MPQMWPPPPPAAGVAPSVSNSSAQLITFPVPFAAAPVVVATAVSSRQAVTVQGVTATGFNCIVAGPAPLPVNWVALPAS